MAIHHVIDVVSVRHGFVAAIRSVNMRLLVSGAIVAWRAFLRISGIHLNPVVLHMPIMKMVQMAIVNVVRVPIVLHSGMTTIWPMLVGVSA